MTGLLAFALSPAGRLIGVALAAVVLLGIAYNRGESSAEARCQAEALRAQLEAAQRDIAVARRQAAQEERDNEALAGENRTLERQRDELRAAVAAGGSSCPADDDWVGRMRVILGQPPAGRP